MTQPSPASNAPDGLRTWLPDLAAVAAALVAGTALVRGLGAARGVDVTVGPDPSMWGTAALSLRVGRDADVPPLFPAAVELVSRLGPAVADAGRAIAALAVGLSAALVYAAVRVAGGSRAAAVVGAVVLLVQPDTPLIGLMFQPDSLTATAFAALALALAGYDRRRDLLALVGLAVAATALVCVREHGLVLLPLLLAFVAVFPPSGLPAARLVAPIVLLAVVAIGPSLLGAAPLGTPPWAWPWLHKFEAPVNDIGLLESGRTPAYVGRGLDMYPSGSAAVLEDLGSRYEDLLALPERARALALLQLHAHRAWALSADVYVLVLVGLLGAFTYSRRPSALAVGLLVSAAVLVPTVVIWSSRRHVVALVPIAAVGAGLGAEAVARLLGERLRVGFLAAVALVVGIAAWSSGTALREAGLRWLATRADELRPWAQVGARIRESTPPDALLTGLDGGVLVHSGGVLQLYAERGRTTDPVPPAAGSPSLIWRVVRIGRTSDGPPASDWAVLAEADPIRALRYRTSVTGAERACLEGVLVEPPVFAISQKMVRTALTARPGCAGAAGAAR